MRRHAEGLIILSGAVPGRGWREPVPVLDVLRAAIAEVEDYTRVDVASETRTRWSGAAVNDVIHLLAELVENATASRRRTPGSRSAPTRSAWGSRSRSRTAVSALPPRSWPRSTRGWPARPSSTWPDSDQLGLFVVGQLAGRHGIKVSLLRLPVRRAPGPC